MEPSIRAEQPEDVNKIETIIKAAFHSHPQSNHNEHLILAGLRREQALALSLVAENSGEIVGHIAFSEVEISDGSPGWFGLGPLAVAPAYQGQGIGTALVRAGLAHLRQMGAHGCVLLGEPSFYRQFGFANDPELLLEEAPQENFLVLSFTGTTAHGVVTYHPAFYAPC